MGTESNPIRLQQGKKQLDCSPARAIHNSAMWKCQCPSDLSLPATTPDHSFQSHSWNTLSESGAETLYTGKAERGIVTMFCCTTSPLAISSLTWVPSVNLVTRRTLKAFRILFTLETVLSLCVRHRLVLFFSLNCHNCLLSWCYYPHFMGNDWEWPNSLSHIVLLIGGIPNIEPWQATPHSAVHAARIQTSSQPGALFTPNISPYFLQ